MQIQKQSRTGAGLLAALCVVIASAIAAGAAWAVDGVIEINMASASAGGVTPGDTAGFPVTIDSPGSYVLTGDLTVPAGQNALLVTSDDVAIDLNGFSLVGPIVCSGSGASLTCPAGSGYGVRADSSLRVRVRNGIVRGFGFGGIRLFDGGEVHDVRVEGNGGPGIQVGMEFAVERVHALRNEDVGISTGWYGTVRDSLSRGNRGTGINVGERALVVDCVSEGNGADGVNALSHLQVTGSTIASNALLGIRGSDATRVVGNVVNSNGGTGIQLLDGSYVADNVVFQNGDTNTEDQVSLGAGGHARANTLEAGASTRYVLNLGSSTGYSYNVIVANAIVASVNGGVDLGQNICNSTAC